MSTSAEGPGEPVDKFEALDKVFELISQRFDHLDKVIESHDEMLGRLLGGMTQLWSGLESLIEFILDDKSPEDKEKFITGLNWYSNELWKAVKQRVDVAGSDPEDTGALGDVPGGERTVRPDPGGDVPADRGPGSGAADAEPDRLPPGPTSREDGLPGGDGGGGG